MRDNRLDILSLCETWHEDAECITIGRLRDLGYNVVEQSRPIAPDANRDNTNFINHGGVALLAKSAIRLTRLTITGDFKSFEFVCCRAASSGTPAIILTVYRPGSAPVSPAFFKQFEAMLERLALMSGVIVITGDLNIRLHRSTDPHCVQFNELLDAFGFQQHVV